MVRGLSEILNASVTKVVSVSTVLFKSSLALILSRNQWPTSYSGLIQNIQTTFRVNIARQFIFHTFSVDTYANLIKYWIIGLNPDQLVLCHSSRSPHLLCSCYHVITDYSLRVIAILICDDDATKWNYGIMCCPKRSQMKTFRKPF